MSRLVAYTLENGIASISMDDGRLNVMSLDMLEQLGAAFDLAEADEAVVVLRSARSGIFSAGFDLKVFAANDRAGSLAMVKAGAELAFRLMSFPAPIVGVVEGHAYPMGTFLLLACDVRIGTPGKYRMGLNEVAIGIAPPGFAVELARSRVHPSWLSRTVTTGEMFQPEDALAAGFLDQVVQEPLLEETIAAVSESMKKLHRPSHHLAKQRLRHASLAAMREAIDSELTTQAYAGRGPSSVVLPGKS